jgi:arginine utilization protein RocB
MTSSVSLGPSTPPGHAEMLALYSLLDIVRDEAKYHSRLDELARARDEAYEAIGKLSNLREKHAAVEAEQAGYASMAEAARNRIADTEAKLADRDAKQNEREVNLAARDAAQDRREKEQDHAMLLMAADLMNSTH